MKKTILLFILGFGQMLVAQNENHLINIKQLTFGGDNAEAYFSFDGKNLSFQSNYKKWGLSCDQIFMMNISDAEKDTLYKPAKISTGKGRTTCSYFLPDGKHILYASTHNGGESCPETGDLRKGGKYLCEISGYFFKILYCGQFHKRVCRRHVIKDIDNVNISINGWVNQVGMFNDTPEREIPLTDI